MKYDRYDKNGYWALWFTRSISTLKIEDVKFVCVGNDFHEPTSSFMVKADLGVVPICII